MRVFLTADSVMSLVADGIPFERPAQFEGKKLEDVDDSEFAELLRQRSEATAARAPSAGGETGAGPIHWYENYSAKNSRAWLVVEPADGRIPPTTPEADLLSWKTGGDLDERAAVLNACGNFVRGIETQTDGKSEAAASTRWTASTTGR